MKTKPPIYVTMPSLPPLAEYMEVLEGPWASGVLTHHGPLVQRLERELQELLRLEHLVAVTNGTVALQLAIRALGVEGEVLTTPFSWIATCSAIQWQGCRPKFVDIDPETFNIDVAKLEEAITDETSAILAVHVFSNPCDVEAIARIADRRNLKVIFDAAHAMCVSYKGRSLLEYGDVSGTSFHATKLFNTGEGGACVTTDGDVAGRLRRMRFFGHDEEKQIVDVGMNGKMTEVHAALGLANLKRLDAVLKKRRAIYDAYRNGLAAVDWVSFQKIDPEAYNYSYMPVVFEDEDRLSEVLRKLVEEQIHARRYFYPALNTINAVSEYTAMPNAEALAKRILCLPSYDRLSLEQVGSICRIVAG